MRVRARSLLRSLFLPWLVELLAANYRFNAVRAVLLLTKLLPAPEAAGVKLAADPPTAPRGFAQNVYDRQSRAQTVPTVIVRTDPGLIDVIEPKQVRPEQHQRNIERRKREVS